MSVLVTRPQPDADRFAAACADAGLTALAAPLMRIACRDDWTAPDAARALIFTSVNGVRAFAARHDERHLPVFCVGATTAACAREHGFATITAAGGDVETLANAVAASGERGPVAHIGGARLAGDLAGALARSGVSAQRIIAYDAIDADELPPPARHAVAADAPLDVALFSPYSARLFLKLVDFAAMTDRLINHRAVCLSDNVADAAREAKWARIAVAATRTSDAMIDLLAQPGA